MNDTTTNYPNADTPRYDVPEAEEVKMLREENLRHRLAYAQASKITSQMQKLLYAAVKFDGRAQLLDLCVDQVLALRIQHDDA